MGDILVRTLTFGSGLSSHTGSSSSSSICLRNLIINIKSINLAAVLTSPFDGFIATKIGTVTEGCGSDSNSTSCRCPGGSVRVGGWRNCLCVCPNPLVPIRGQCNNPCLPNPCSNSGFCSVLSASNGGRFSCQCKDTYSGPLCEEEEEEECDVGFFKSSSSCQRCRCDLDGVEDAVCDRITGACFCKVSNIYLFTHHITLTPLTIHTCTVSYHTHTTHNTHMHSFISHSHHSQYTHAQFHITLTPLTIHTCTVSYHTHTTHNTHMHSFIFTDYTQNHILTPHIHHSHSHSQRHSHHTKTLSPYTHHHYTLTPPAHTHTSHILYTHAHTLTHTHNHTHTTTHTHSTHTHTTSTHSHPPVHTHTYHTHMNILSLTHMPYTHTYLHTSNK